MDIRLCAPHTKLGTPSKWTLVVVSHISQSISPYITKQLRLFFFFFFRDVPTSLRNLICPNQLSYTMIKQIRPFLSLFYFFKFFIIRMFEPQGFFFFFITSFFNNCERPPKFFFVRPVFFLIIVNFQTNLHTSKAICTNPTGHFFIFYFILYILEYPNLLSCTWPGVFFFLLKIIRNKKRNNLPQIQNTCWLNLQNVLHGCHIAIADANYTILFPFLTITSLKKQARRYNINLHLSNF